MIALRRGLLAAFVVGLGLSITLAEGALICLTFLWLWRLRDAGVRRSQQWPLWRPVLAFTVATLLSVLASGQVEASLIASKTLLLTIALYVTADALEDAREGDRFVSWLALSAGGATMATCSGAALGISAIGSATSWRQRSEIRKGLEFWPR